MKLRVLILIFLASCMDKVDKEAKICSDPAIPETQVKMFRDSIFVDSLITIIPINPQDTLRFLSVNFDDSTETIMQRKIFEQEKINHLIKFDNRIVDFWFTRCVYKTDSTKDFGVFIVLKRDKKAIENCRFRFNEKHEIVGVNNNAFIYNNFMPIDSWISDTLTKLLDE